MKKGFMLLVAVLTAAIFFSCNKEKTGKHCWQVIDNLGNDIGIVCNKTESQMMDDYPNHCSFYRVEENFCWLLDGSIYVENKPESYIALYQQCFGQVTATKVPCGYCAKYYTREKHLYKPTNTFFYSAVRLQQYCGDTVQTLFHGRIVTLRETADSLITVQFSSNGTF